MARVLSVVAAVRRDLRAIGRLDRDLARGGLAAAALAMAVQLDDPDVEASAKASCARTLKTTMEKLMELAPSKQTEDNVHELGDRARLKLAGRATP